ncbi:MAG: hypothetical protein VB112_03185 [Oscillospiraceae bacterium]|nr:hypothetical protein [Oscillospiraceae bacterium]
MKIITGGTEYAVSGKPTIRAGYIRIPLAAVPETLGDTVQIADNSGAVLRDITVADYLRWYTSDSALIFTDTAAATEPTAKEIAAAEAARAEADAKAAAIAALPDKVAAIETAIDDLTVAILEG